MPVPEVIPQRYEPNVPLDRLVPHPANANQGDLGLLCELVDANGFAGAVLAQESTGLLIDGEHRLKMALEKGMTGLPVLWLDVDDDGRDRLLASLNELTRRGRNDEARLVALLQGLAGTERGLEGAAFDGDDLDALIAGLNGQQGGGGGEVNGDPDEVPEPPAKPVTQLGDTWLLGPHRITCGDCRDFGTIEKLLRGERVNVAFTSPPYASQRAYDESSGFKPIPPDEYADWFEDVQANVRVVLAEDGSWFVNIKEHAHEGQRDLYVKDLTIAHVRRWGWRFVDELCWVRDGLPGRWNDRFKNNFEPVFHFAGGGAVKFRPYEVAHESSRTFRYAPERGFSMKQDAGYTATAPHSEEEGLALPGNVLDIGSGRLGMGTGLGHSAAFPVELPTWFIRAYSDPGDTVFDPFMGSGSTLIAAHQENRVAYGCEISPAYCDVIARRFQTLTGIKPERVLEDGTTEPVSFTEPES